MTENRNKKPFKIKKPDTIEFIEPKRDTSSFSKYDPKYDKMLLEHMAKGFSLASFTEAKVCTTTLYKWLEVHPTFKESHDLGVMYRMKLLEAAGIKMAVKEGNATVWKALMQEFGFVDKVEVVNKHEVLDTNNPMVDVTPEKMKRLQRIKELTEELGLNE